MENAIFPIQIDTAQNYNEDYFRLEFTKCSGISSKLHEHSFAEIVLVLSGHATYIIDGERYNLRNYDILIIPTYTLHKFECVKDEEFEAYVLWLYSERFKKLSTQKTMLLSELTSFGQRKQYLIRDPEFTVYLKQTFDRIMTLNNEKEYGYDLLISNAFVEALISTSRYVSLKKDVYIAPSGDKNVRQIIDYIDDNISGELSLNEIAEYMHLDLFYISHIFSKEMGITIHKYIIKKRLSNAKKLLDEGKEIKDIIKEVGFKDESHFVQSFKKEFGITPRKYQKQKLVVVR